MPDRKTVFDKLVSDVDERQLAKCVDFAQHRFVSIESDKLTHDRYAKGHKSLRGACNHLARAVEEGEAYVPEMVVDLDTGTRHELDLIAFVAPKEVNAVGLMLPRQLAETLRSIVSTTTTHQQSPQHIEQLGTLIKQAIDRR
jgi:hypothetical protein